MATFLGLDPGKTGGLVAIDGDGLILSWLVMPVGHRDIWEWLTQWREDPGKTRAAVEWIHPAIQGVGKASMSKLYGNYTALQMGLVAAGIRLDTVKPRDWQKAVGISPRNKSESDRQWKDRLRARAQELFPEVGLWNMPRTKGKQLAVCDAMMIAEWLRRRELMERSLS
jgi:hypothetical protein